MPLDNCGDENRESPATNHPTPARWQPGERPSGKIGFLWFSGYSVNLMFPEFFRRLATHDKSASRIDLGPPKTLTGALLSNDDANWWMITLSDLTLLLLGFLVAWYVIDKKDLTLQQPPVASSGTAQEPKPSVAPNQNSLIPDEWKIFREEMQRFVDEMGLDKEVFIDSAPNEMVISLKDTVPFDSGKADLRQQVVPVLEKVVTMVSSQPGLTLEVSGHSDNIPISTSKFPSNWELSAARASRVARYVIENGIDASRVSVRGYANKRPLLSNSSVGNRSSNRRVEVRLYRGAGQHPIP
jgi:chemotaxis protein MotB